MELVVRKTDLLRELQLFQGIVERKNTIPILANVLLEANGTEVKMLATDLEVGLRSKCAATVSKSGSLTLPAKKLYEIVKALPETDVRIEEDKGGVKVAADRFDSRMQTLPREDFPTLPERDRRDQRDAAARRAAADDLEDAVRDHRRRHALFPQRRALPPAARLDGPGLDRRASPRAHHRGARDDQGRQGREERPTKKCASSCRARRCSSSAGCSRKGRRGHPLRARREPPVLHARRAAADFADDRRPVPGVRARHPEEQRQARRVRSRSPHERGQARRAALERTVARGEGADRQGQGRDRLEQPRVRRGEGNPDGRLRRARR